MFKSIHASHHTFIGSPFDVIMQKVGGKSLYQYLTFVFFFFQWVLTGMILLSPNFLFLERELRCPGGVSGKACQQWVCQKDPSEWLKYVEQGQKSIVYSVYPPLMCERQVFVNVIQTVCYAGIWVGFFIFPQIADKLGRKISMNVSWIFCVVGCGLLSFTNNIYLLIIGLFLAGFGSDPAVTTHYSLITQQVTGSLRSKMSASLQIGYACGTTLVGLLFYLRSDWQENVFFFFFLPSILMQVCCMLIVESPVFSLCHDKKSEALRDLNIIALVNGRNLINKKDIQEVQGLQIQQQNYNFLDLFKTNKIRKQALITGFIFFAFEIIFYGIIFLLEEVGIEVHINQMTVGVASAIGFFITQLTVNTLPRKKFTIICLLVSSVLCVSLFLTQEITPEDCDRCWVQYLQLALLFVQTVVVCMSWSLFYIYISQLYPGKIRATGIGWVSMVGTIGSVLAPLSNKITWPLLYFGGIALMSGALMFLLKQTLGRKIQQDIKESIQQKLIK